MSGREKRPRITIGLPVYNGERYLRASIDSILDQTFPDFELIISDNASTDSTPDLCRHYAARDPRVRYHRQDRNRGGFWNHYHVIELARSDFFMWAAHDDVREPEYLAACIEVLDAQPEVVLCYCATVNIDENAVELDVPETEIGADASLASVRFRELSRMDYRLEPIYGVMRLETLRRTGLQGQYADSDRVLLAELALHGRFHRVPRVLFRRREHAGRSIRMYSTRQERTAWIHPEDGNKIVFPYFRQLTEYLKAIARSAPPGIERLRCHGHMLGWTARHWRLLASDVEYALRVMASPIARRIKRLTR